MENHFEEISNYLQQGKKLILARIIKQRGSIPRAAGTQCLVLEDGSLKGTIGGGLLEYRVMERAKECLKKKKSSVMHFELTGDEVAQTDMLCGGSADVYLEPLFPRNAVAGEIFKRIGSLINEGRKGVLLTLVSDGIGPVDDKSRLLIEEDGSTTGEIGIIPGGDKKRWAQFLKIKTPKLTEMEKGKESVFVEPIRPYDILYLFGAGHVSTFVASLASMVGFRVIVIDDRKEFANRERFKQADELIVLPFSDVFEKIHISSSSYIVIITRGHIQDLNVLREALKRSDGYIGMIGSKRKREKIYQALMEEGVSDERLKQVHSPIGLDIDAETPEEIAVSIVAELIQARASSDRDP
ncbi:MAG: XdhC/CoxI family protein [Thermodesulfobacteriota bacterium]|nr:XdhC/CoxI family protein [Thermodesulfobacteriota bacterium]